MVHQAPTGARDLLPLDVIQKRWIEDRLQDVFPDWGYHRIITSTIEHLGTLMAGGAIQREAVLQVEGEYQGELGLRPELTASIARAAVTRLATAPHPLRLYYNGNVFRRVEQSGHRFPQELFQAGVELIGAGTALADVEVLLLLTNCLTTLGLTAELVEAQHPLPWSLVLGEAELTASLLEPFPTGIRATVRSAIARLDRITLEALPLSDTLREHALFVLDLRGDPAHVLERVKQLDLSNEQRDRVSRLETIVNQFKDSLVLQFPQLRGTAPLVLDLSLIRTFDYYTGISFEVVYQTDVGQWVLGQGGRYDQLLGQYHPHGESYPSVGFSLNIEAIQQVLAAIGNLPATAPASDWLVVPTDPEAYGQALMYAQQLREAATPVRAELYLEPNIDTPTVREYARRHRISQVAWIRLGAEPELELL
ncbi:MAG: ATP phosphoribosyltransferase regulatory subunit [Cyanobacteria bacterium P01_H01_bin.121]